MRKPDMGASREDKTSICPSLTFKKFKTEGKNTKY
jgi:hypothetical protein